MTFYDIDGTPYGPKEYAADKMVVMQAETSGVYVPPQIKRRVSDYESGWNPFDRKYEQKKYTRETSFFKPLGVILGLFAAGVVIGGIVSIFNNGTPVGEFFGNVFPFLLPGLYIIYHWICFCKRFYNDEKDNKK